MIATHFKVWSHNNALPSPTQPYPSTACGLLCQMCNSATIYIQRSSYIYWSFSKGLFKNYVTVFFATLSIVTLTLYDCGMTFSVNGLRLHSCLCAIVQPLMLSIVLLILKIAHFILLWVNIIASGIFRKSVRSILSSIKFYSIWDLTFILLSFTAYI